MGEDTKTQETQVFLFCLRGRRNTREGTESCHVCRGWYKDTGKEVPLLERKKEALKILIRASPRVGNGNWASGWRAKGLVGGGFRGH